MGDWAYGGLGGPMGRPAAIVGGGGGGGYPTALVLLSPNLDETNDPLNQGTLGGQAVNGNGVDPDTTWDVNTTTRDGVNVWVASHPSSSITLDLSALGFDDDYLPVSGTDKSLTLVIMTYVDGSLSDRADYAGLIGSGGASTAIVGLQNELGGSQPEWEIHAGNQEDNFDNGNGNNAWNLWVIDVAYTWDGGAGRHARVVHAYRNDMTSAVLDDTGVANIFPKTAGGTEFYIGSNSKDMEPFSEIAYASLHAGIMDEETRANLKSHLETTHGVTFA